MARFCCWRCRCCLSGVGVRSLVLLFPFSPPFHPHPPFRFLTVANCLATFLAVSLFLSFSPPSFFSRFVRRQYLAIPPLIILFSRTGSFDCRSKISDVWMLRRKSWSATYAQFTMLVRCAVGRHRALRRRASYAQFTMLSLRCVAPSGDIVAPSARPFFGYMAAAKRRPEIKSEKKKLEGG